MPIVCGIDEVGRGSLAGPLISVAAMFDGDRAGCSGICDSKKLTPAKREKVFKEILRSPLLLDFGIGSVDPNEIDSIGIHQANILAFRRALHQARKASDYIIIDGDCGIPNLSGHGPQRVEPKADNNYEVVGAASILAKVIRDRYMDELDQLPNHDVYEWRRNKGYGSKAHRDAILTYGPSFQHRRSFLRKILAE